MALADDVGLQVMGEPVERDRALLLVSAAVRRWARPALASRETTHAQALGIDSLDLSSLEALDYASPIVRDEYLVEVDVIAAEVLAAAADAAESAWGLRLLNVPGGGASAHERHFDTALAREVAEHSARALGAAARAGLVDLLAEAKQLAAQMHRPPPPAK